MTGADQPANLTTTEADADRVPTLGEYVRSVVDAAPLLSPDQRDRLTYLLRGTQGSAAA